MPKHSSLFFVFAVFIGVIQGIIVLIAITCYRGLDATASWSNLKASATIERELAQGPDY
ncbi:MAG: hypothetical protein PVI90_11645 [Desulfobacteraceae bacterium]